VKRLLFFALAVLAGVLTSAFYQGGSTGQFGYSTEYLNYMSAPPTVATKVTGTQGIFWFYCNNTTGNAATITITDNQATPVSFVTAFSLPPNSDVTFPASNAYMLMKGIQWSQGTSGAINCLIQGYTP
jgi:hypothetical protein